MRTIWASDELEGQLNFPHARGVIRIERHVTNLDGASPRHEVSFGITSLSATERGAPKRLLGLQRGHWTIENGLHWVRDVTYDEDRSQVRKGNGPQAMASLRNLAISVLRLARAQSIAKAVRYCARNLRACMRLIGLQAL